MGSTLALRRSVFCYPLDALNTGSRGVANFDTVYTDFIPVLLLDGETDGPSLHPLYNPINRQ